MGDTTAWKYKINLDFTSGEPFTLKAVTNMTINCDTCFNKKYYLPWAIKDVCDFCKEHNGRFYRPDLSDIKGYVISCIKENEK